MTLCIAGALVTMELIDAHEHLHAEECDTDLAAVLEAAESAGVRTILAVSKTVADTLADVTTENTYRPCPGATTQMSSPGMSGRYSRIRSCSTLKAADQGSAAYPQIFVRRLSGQPQHCNSWVFPRFENQGVTEVHIQCHETAGLGLADGDQFLVGS